MASKACPKILQSLETNFLKLHKENKIKSRLHHIYHSKPQNKMKKLITAFKLAKWWRNLSCVLLIPLNASTSPPKKFQMTLKQLKIQTIAIRETLSPIMGFLLKKNNLGSKIVL